jgi:hypothetical protein
MAKKRNSFSEISEELGGEMFRAFKDAHKASPVPYGMQVATSKGQRDQAWRARILGDVGVFREEFMKDKETFRKRWEA